MQTNILKEQRIKRGISMKDLAKETGLSLRYLYFIERGEKNPSMKTAKKIADALHLSIDEIFFVRT